MNQLQGFRERYKDVIEEKGKRIKRRVIFIVESIALCAGIFFCLYWFDWRMFVVISLLMFSNNLMVARKK